MALLTFRCLEDSKVGTRKVRRRLEGGAGLWMLSSKARVEEQTKSMVPRIYGRFYDFAGEGRERVLGEMRQDYKRSRERVD